MKTYVIVVKSQSLINAWILSVFAILLLGLLSNHFSNLGSIFKCNKKQMTYNGFDFELLFFFVPLCKELHGNQVGDLFQEEE